MSPYLLYKYILNKKVNAFILSLKYKNLLFLSNISMKILLKTSKIIIFKYMKWLLSCLIDKKFVNAWFLSLLLSSIATYS